jgi:hypothetical protein
MKNSTSVFTFIDCHEWFPRYVAWQISQGPVILLLQKRNTKWMQIYDKLFLSWSLQGSEPVQLIIMQDVYIHLRRTDLWQLTCNSPQWTALPIVAWTSAQGKGRLYENALTGGVQSLGNPPTEPWWLRQKQMLPPVSSPQWLHPDTEMSKNSQPLMRDHASVRGYFYSKLQFHGTEPFLEGWQVISYKYNTLTPTKLKKLRGF